MYVEYSYVFAYIVMPCPLTLKRIFSMLCLISMTETLQGFYGYLAQIIQIAHSPHKVVLFGSSVYVECMHHHLDRLQSSVAKDIKRSLYVYNVISGCQSEDEILNYYTTARAIMSNAHYNLCSWAFNSSKLQVKAQANDTLLMMHLTQTHQSVSLA